MAGRGGEVRLRRRAGLVGEFAGLGVGVALVAIKGIGILSAELVAIGVLRLHPLLLFLGHGGGFFGIVMKRLVRAVPVGVGAGGKRGGCHQETRGTQESHGCLDDDLRF
jgi:hypothetical protein